MDVEIRSIAPEEFEAYVTAVERSFGVHARQEEIELFRRELEPEFHLAAFEGSTIVGTAAAVPFDLSVPGGMLPMPGVTAVGVQPTHRRRGLLTMLMRRQLDDYREMGRPLAGLWASEGPIYQRFGYGMATLAGGIEIERDRAAYFGPHEPHGRVTLIDKPEALEIFPAIYERVLARQPGMLSRSKARWDVVHADLEHWRNGFGALFFALHQDQAGQPDGYITYRVKSSWDDSANVLKVRELMAETFDAYSELWRFSLDHDLMAKIEAWPRPPDEPLLHMLAHPRALSLKFGDGMWLRLIDVPASLSGRRYSAAGTIVFEVRDSFCPWSEGRYELAGGPDGAQCATTHREPDLLVDIRDLGAAFLGGTRFGALARAGRVREETPGSLARADAMFEWDRAPWCPEVF